MSSEKTLSRVLEAYVWKDMRTDIRQTIAKCVICKLWQKRSVKTKMGEMPVASYPMQIISMDFIGPFVPSEKTNLGMYLTS